MKRVESFKIKNIIDNKLFSQKYFGQIYEKNPILEKVFINIILMKLCNILNHLE